MRRLGKLTATARSWGGRVASRAGFVTRSELDAVVERLTPRIDWLGVRTDALEEREGWRLEELAELTNRTAIETVTRFLRHVTLREQPLISVVLPTRNRADLLQRAIASVLAQRYPNWEVLVVEDGGSERSRAVVEAAGDRRISWSWIEAGGVSAARNHALRAASGELIAYLDDDNVMDPGWLHAVAWAFEQRPQVDVVYGAWVVDDYLRIAKTSSGALPTTLFHPWDRGALRQGTLADMGATAHRNGLANAWFDEDLRDWEDWDLLLRLTAEKDPLALPVVACYYFTDAPNRNHGGKRCEADRAIVRERALRLGGAGESEPVERSAEGGPGNRRRDEDAALRA